MRWIDLLGYAASLAVLATFCMTRIVPLRLTAIGSNVLFVLFGALAHIYPVLLLHALLLPVNVLRLLEVWRLQGFRTAPVPSVPAVSPEASAAAPRTRTE